MDGAVAADGRDPDQRVDGRHRLVGEGDHLLDDGVRRVHVPVHVLPRARRDVIHRGGDDAADLLDGVADLERRGAVGGAEDSWAACLLAADHVVAEEMRTEDVLEERVHAVRRHVEVSAAEHVREVADSELRPDQLAPKSVEVEGAFLRKRRVTAKPRRVRAIVELLAGVDVHQRAEGGDGLVEEDALLLRAGHRPA